MRAQRCALEVEVEAREGRAGPETKAMVGCRARTLGDFPVPGLETRKALRRWLVGYHIGEVERAAYIAKVEAVLISNFTFRHLEA